MEAYFALVLAAIQMLDWEEVLYSFHPVDQAQEVAQDIAQKQERSGRELDRTPAHSTLLDVDHSAGWVGLALQSDVSVVAVLVEEP